MFKMLKSGKVERFPQNGWKSPDADTLEQVLEDRRIDTICLGPGLGLDARAAGLVAAALRVRNPPKRRIMHVVLDADAVWEVPGPWSLHVLGGSGTIDGASATEGTLHARAPGNRVVAGDEGMVVLACGAPV